MRTVLVCLLAWSLAACQPSAAKPDLSSFLQNKKAAVLVFLAPDCPLSQNYTLTLNQLHAEFQGGGIEIYGLVPGASFKKGEIDEFTKKYNVAFPVSSDRDLELADFFGATKTPEAFVVTPDGKTLYKGAIDNWAVNLGEHRRIITEHYLRNVLDNVREGRAIPYSETTAIGCFIERPA
jgi:peroxiredoxin